MCDCINKMNELLVERNAQLITNMFGAPRAFLTLSKLDEKKRGKPPLLQPDYCPFCGEKYKSLMEPKSEPFLSK
jgi:5'-3' exonuclease